MIELSRRGDGWSLGYGGDVLNTAIHLSRFGHDVCLYSALGDDPLSEELRGRWTAEGLDCSMVLTSTQSHAGIYAITVDAAGERSFTYWRALSAARAMFDLAGCEEALDKARHCDLLYFSLVSLAILSQESRETLLRLASDVRANGGRVAFDSNYRPRLWVTPQLARQIRDSAIAVADIGLPTLEDEVALGGAGDADDCSQHWTSLGCAETVVKFGAKGCRLPDGTLSQPERAVSPVDTSGAGDAFNAGYLSERLNGADPARAATRGHAIAGWTIMRSGAIPARDDKASYI
ncbi:MAG: sugar kinase [Novosphingobium sp.]|nr:sugar kinase [Novosphingobium sp.]